MIFLMLLNLAVLLVVVTLLLSIIKKERKLMSTIQEIMDGIANMTTLIGEVDLTLDAVKAKIDALEAGSVVTQAQIDELAAAVTTAKARAQSVLEEATGLAAPKPA